MGRAELADAAVELQHAAGQLDVRRLEHRVHRMDQRDQAERLDQPQRIAVHGSLAPLSLVMPQRGTGILPVSFISNTGRAAGFTSCTGRKLVPFHPDTGWKPVPRAL